MVAKHRSSESKAEGFLVVDDCAPCGERDYLPMIGKFLDPMDHSKNLMMVERTGNELAPLQHDRESASDRNQIQQNNQDRQSNIGL